MRYWLFKSEPCTFSINDLRCCSKQTEHWEGVRNYQARNMLRDEIKQGDLGFFYHSNCQPPGIVGVIKVVKEGYPDFTAWDPHSKYFDSKSSKQHPRWFMVDVQLARIFSRMIPLHEIKQHPKLRGMLVNRKGNRLSITPVKPAEWNIIMQLAEHSAVSI